MQEAPAPSRRRSVNYVRDIQIPWPVACPQQRRTLMPEIRRDEQARRLGPEPIEVHESTALSKRGDLNYVYLVSDDRGRLLYVGVTSDIYARFGQHARQSLWYPYMAHMAVEVHSTRRQAEMRERRLIGLYDPPHNSDHKVPTHSAHFRRHAVLAASERAGADSAA